MTYHIPTKGYFRDYGKNWVSYPEMNPVKVWKTRER